MKNRKSKKSKKPDPYGYELIIDLHNCEVSKFNKKSLESYFIGLCKAIDMERRGLHFWDDLDSPLEERPTLPKTQGISAVQFIVTSSVVIHALTRLGAAYVNIFSCKYFDKKTAEDLTLKWFNPKKHYSKFIERV